MNYPPFMYTQAYGGYTQLTSQDSEQVDQNNQEQLRQITQFIKNLRDPLKREDALNSLSKKR